MDDFAVESPEYDPRKKPQSRYNRAVARKNGWCWDRDLQTYRNRDKYAMDADGNFPDNPVDCLR